MQHIKLNSLKVKPSNISQQMEINHGTCVKIFLQWNIGPFSTILWIYKLLKHGLSAGWNMIYTNLIIVRPLWVLLRRNKTLFLREMEKEEEHNLQGVL